MAECGPHPRIYLRVPTLCVVDIILCTCSHPIYQIYGGSLGEPKLVNVDLPALHKGIRKGFFPKRGFYLRSVLPCVFQRGALQKRGSRRDPISQREARFPLPLSVIIEP